MFFLGRNCMSGLLRAIKYKRTVKKPLHDATLSHGGPRDAAAHFDTYQILQRHRAVSLPQHSFLVGLCLQTAVNYLSTRSPMLGSV